MKSQIKEEKRIGHIQYPEPKLADFIDYYWYIDAYQPEHSCELTLPDGSVDIIFNLIDTPMKFYDKANRLIVCRSSVLCGPHSHYFSIDTAGEGKVVGIHFKPGGVKPFLSYPLNEVHNQLVPLESVWGWRAKELHESLLEAHSPAELFGILERSLQALVCNPLERRREIEFIRMNLHHQSVHALVEQQDMSHRWLALKFKEEIGLTPKAMSRVLRFQQVLHLLNQRQEVDWDWAEIALACSYYDQAHFCKEFKAFSGISPSDYLPIKGRQLNHAVARNKDSDLQDS